MADTKTKKKNKNLTAAKKARNDEFFTRLTDIEHELNHYNGLNPTGSTNHFKDKVVFCNCDDAKESNFFKYFALNFRSLGLKKLICVGYAKSGIKSCFDKGDERHAWKIEIDHMDDFNGDTAVDLADAEWLIEHQQGVLTQLKGDGDFRSEESIELLKQADIVVTNPPFSLASSFVELLVKYNKQFLFIGNKNMITYKEVFPLIKDNKLWMGYTSPTDFIQPETATPVSVNGLCRWFTNIPTQKRQEILVLGGNYAANPAAYPKYDNYDAIEVSKVIQIPRDYFGVMGVPITFLDKYNPTQFEILGLMSGGSGGSLINGNDGNPKFNIKGKGVYARILIRRLPGSTDGWDCTL